MFKFRFVDLAFGLAIIVADLFVFMIFGLLLMGYEDQYDPSKGEIWSLASMNTSEKIMYIAYKLWIILNIIGLFYIGRKIFMKRKKKPSGASIQD